MNRQLDAFNLLGIFRNFFAGIGIFLSKFVNKMFDLIGSLADLNFMSKFGNDILNRVYIFVGIFVLFKAAIIIIRYVINPDELLDKKKGAQKFLINILISLALITAGPTIFDQLFNAQAIILNENVLGKLVFGSKSDEQTISNFGKKSTYYIFSSFIRYNENSDLKPFFENCPNIFRELDTEYSSATTENYCGTSSYEYYRCATFLTKGANMSLDFSTDDYLDNLYYGKNLFVYDSRSNIVVDSAVHYYSDLSLEENEKRIKNVNYYSAFKINANNSLDGYKHVVSKPLVGNVSIGFNTCREHMINAGYCGAENGIYLYWLIQRGRIENDVSKIYASEILTAKYADYLTYILKRNRGETTFDDGDVNPDDPNGGACVCDSTGASRDAETCNKSAGDFIFDFDMFLPIIFGLVYLFVLFFLCIDIGLRAIKLAFLRVMSPIPFVSYMDIKESKLFSQWLKMFINAYLDLFIKLGCIYLAAFVSDIILSDDLKITKVGDDSFAKIIFMIGLFFFAKKFPDFISKMFNLGGDQGSISYMKKATSYLLGFGKTALIGGATFAGGAALSAGANAANSIKDIPNTVGMLKDKNVSVRNKADYVLQKLGSAPAGAISGGFRSVAEYAKNGGGKFSFNNIRNGVMANNEARVQNEAQRGTINPFNRDFKDGSRTLNRAAGHVYDGVNEYLKNVMGTPLDADRLKQQAMKHELNSITKREDFDKAYAEKKDAYTNAKKELDDFYYGSSHRDKLDDAFSSSGKVNPKNFEESLKYKTFEEFNNANPGALDIGSYNEAYRYYEKYFYAKMEKEMYDDKDKYIH